MKKNLSFLICMLGALSLPVLFASCGDDDEGDEKEEVSATVEDDDSNAGTEDESGGGSEDTTVTNDVNVDGEVTANVCYIVTDAGDTLLLSSIERDGSSYMSYGLASNGLPTSVTGYTITYSPSFKLYAKNVSYAFTVNSLGYIKSYKYTYFMTSADTYTETADFTYDDAGHLIKATSTAKNLYDDGIDSYSSSTNYSSTFTWNDDGDLTKATIKFGTYEETREISYLDTENTSRQPLLGILLGVLSGCVFNDNVIGQLGSQGFFGAGTTHLPAQCNDDLFFSYELNDDGTISKEVSAQFYSISYDIGSHTYTYSYKTFTSGN